MLSLNDFKKQRNEALLSMSADNIMRIMRMNGEELPKDKWTFWVSVHKARTAIPGLPMYAKMYSKRWLKENDFYSMDDGELLKWL